MSPITHFLIGWTVASAAPTLSKKERAFVTLASVVPDFDGLGIVVDQATRHSAHPTHWWDYHHLLGHNLGCAIVVTGLAVVFARQRLKTGLLVWISFHLHLLGDLVGAKGPDGDHWPIPYLLPFSKRWQLAWSGQWPLNAWQNMIITAVLLLLAMVLARRRGYSPLEMISKSADGAFVRALRERFPPKRTLELGI
jgi:inner membrane protein